MSIPYLEGSRLAGLDIQSKNKNLTTYEKQDTLRKDLLFIYEENNMFVVLDQKNVRVHDIHSFKLYLDFANVQTNQKLIYKYSQPGGDIATTLTLAQDKKSFQSQVQVGSKHFSNSIPVDSSTDILRIFGDSYQKTLYNEVLIYARFADNWIDLDPYLDDSNFDNFNNGLRLQLSKSSIHVQYDENGYSSLKELFGDYFEIPNHHRIYLA